MNFAPQLNRIILLLLVGILVFACNPTKHVPKNQKLLSLNIVTCDNKDIQTKPIYNYLKQKENTKTALFFNFHLWVYNISHDKSDKEKRLKRWLGIYKMGKIIGEPPVIMDTVLNERSVKQVESYMLNKGYYRSQVKDVVETFGRRDNKAMVTYDIQAGRPIKIRDIRYHFQDTIISKLVMNDTTNCLLKPEGNLNVDVMQQERKRITSLLKENGFFKFSKEYIYYKVDTSKSDFYADVDLNIINMNDSSIHQQYTLNNIYYFNDFEPEEFMKNKESYYTQFDTVIFGDNYFLSRKKSIVKPKVIKYASYLDKGHLYSSLDVNNTFRHLSSMNEYKLINIRYNELKDTSKLDVMVQLSPFPKYNYIAELEGTNSSGNLGVGGRLSFEHKSLFRGAEILNVSVYGKLESQNTFSKGIEENIAFNSQEAGANVSIHFPQFLLPINSEEFIKNYNPKTVLEFKVNYKDRPEYTRSIYGSSFGYYWASKKYFKHSVKVIDLSAVKVFDMSNDYLNSIENTYLEKSFDDYLISATNYSLYYSNKKQRKGKNHLSIMFNGEIAGNLLNLYSTAVDAEPVNGSYNVLNNKFAQYWRTDIDFRYNMQLKRKSDHLIFRFYSGYALPYGNITAMPYVKQFYSGGANGIRAWPVRSLGPGSYINSTRKYYNEAADLKLEANIEYRFKLFWVMEGALFVDAGNIWATNAADPRDGAQFEIDSFHKEIAIGTGFGFRFDFSFFILRLDYGIKVRDPKESEAHRWLIVNEGYNPFGADYSMFNFGIGYPF